MADQTIFADIARLRWPIAERVLGTGQFAVLSRCAPRPTVRLFETRTEAFVVAHQPCSPGCKATAHDWLPLEKPAPRYVKKPHWANQIDVDD
jgi:hypothetical protein